MAHPFSLTRDAGSSMMAGGGKGALMDEREWLEEDDVVSMLAFLGRRASRRKLRLFVCDCCRRMYHYSLPRNIIFRLLCSNMIPPKEYLAAVDVAERYADGLASAEQLEVARQAAERAADKSTKPNEARWHYIACQAASRGSTAPHAVVATNAYYCPFLAWSSEDEVFAQAESLRDIFGNPFVAQRIEAAWLRWNDGTVRRIAEGIYEERAFGRMPVLADALLDSGCDNEAMLEHCRKQEGVHARGCWVLDAILGRK
jgi:hypothetical protein